MYPKAVEMGIPATEYWSMTLDEIITQVEANKNIQERERKERAMFDYVSQRLASFAFNDPSKMPKFDEAYGFLNPTEEQETEDMPEWEKEKLMFMKQSEIIRQTLEKRK